MSSPTLLFLAIVTIVFVPGVLWARLLVKDFSEQDLIVQTGLGFGLGITIVPGFIFFTNAIFSVPIGIVEISVSVALLAATPILLERYGEGVDRYVRGLFRRTSMEE